MTTPTRTQRDPTKINVYKHGDGEWCLWIPPRGPQDYEGDAIKAPYGDTYWPSHSEACRFISTVIWHREYLYGGDEWFMPCELCDRHLEAGVEAWVLDDAQGNAEKARCLYHGNPNYGQHGKDVQAVAFLVRAENIGLIDHEDWQASDDLAFFLVNFGDGVVEYTPEEIIVRLMFDT